MKIKLTKELTKQQLNKEIKTIVSNTTSSKSLKMKELFNLGLTIKEIQTTLEENEIKVIYNFVYNVISNYVNINDIELIKEEKVNKKKLIIDLYNEGKTNKEISKELKTNYNYVLKVIKEHNTKLINEAK